MSSERKTYLSPEEYLAIERKAEIKSEYRDGEMLAMSGGSEEHNLIVTNIVAELRQQLKNRPCKVYPGNMRVKVSPTGLYTYPDVAVVCGQSLLEDQYADTLLNPTLIVEVLSPSTEKYDRGRKFNHYRRVESLKEYVLVAQDEPLVERYIKEAEDRWVLADARSLDDSVQLLSIDCALSLREVYDKVEFSPPSRDLESQNLG